MHVEDEAADKRLRPIASNPPILITKQRKHCLLHDAIDELCQNMQEMGASFRKHF